MKKLWAAAAAAAFSVAATVAIAQTMTPPAGDPIKRTPLQKSEYPEGYFTYIMMIEIQPNATVARHTHPGVETSYMLEGELELAIDGKSPLKLKAGDSFVVPANTPHSAKTGATMAKVIGTFVVDKTKPIASPAP
jgi:quercetin dioxygenase-like cupin family protein